MASTVYRRRENRKGTNRSKTMRTERRLCREGSAGTKERRSERRRCGRETRGSTCSTADRAASYPTARWPFNSPLLQRIYTVLCFIPAATSWTHHALRVSLSFSSASSHKHIFRANMFCVASENARRAVALKAGDSI